MSNLSSVIKSIQDIMRQDSGVDGDAQRISQLTWLLFLKVFDALEEQLELTTDNFKSPLPEALRWRNWAADPEGITGDALLDFINNDLFTTLKNLSGDAQRNRNHHGAPYQALCLWSGEIIDALAADGHPIAPGRAGENITLRGLDWSDVRPGVRLRVGSVLCEISCYAEPCRHLAQWFTDGRFDRIRHDKGDVSRVYATVLEPGVVAVDDDAVLEPT